MDWKILDTGRSLAHENMQLDERLLQSLEYTDQPIIHLYDWEGDSATYGYFANPADLIDLKEAENQGLKLAKRPTGGGIIFHAFDLAFSVLIPSSHPKFSLNTLENYALINNRVALAIESFLGGVKKTTLFSEDVDNQDTPTFCMVKPTIYDVVVEGRKVLGSAQRKTKWGFLHQGSICLTLPQPKDFNSIVTSSVVEMMEKNSYPLLGKQVDAEILALSRRRLKRLIIEALVKITPL